MIWHGVDLPYDDVTHWWCHTPVLIRTNVNYADLLEGISSLPINMRYSMPGENFLCRIRNGLDRIFQVKLNSIATQRVCIEDICNIRRGVRIGTSIWWLSSNFNLEWHGIIHINTVVLTSLMNLRVRTDQGLLVRVVCGVNSKNKNLKTLERFGTSYSSCWSKTSLVQEADLWVFHHVFQLERT